MTRIIVHAGFHKTGTTSLQAFVERNAQRLKPNCDIYIKTDLGRARYLGRLYGQRPSPWRRWIFKRGFRKFLCNIPDAKTIFISRESFSGMMPGFTRFGRNPVTDYAHQAIPLAKTIIAELHHRFGPECEIEFLYTTRESKSWLESIYRHILRTNRLREDFETFASRFGPSTDLDAEVQKIAQEIAPVRVHSVSLESTAGHRLGHGTAVLDLIGVSKDQWPDFPVASHNNPGPSAALSQDFLSLNRAGGSKRQLKVAKAELTKAERRARK